MTITTAAMAMNETGPVLERIEALMAFYERTPDRCFLLLEEYRENDPPGRLRYTVEIKEHDPEEAGKTFGDEELVPVADNLYMKQRTNLASEADTSKIYAEVTGSEVVARLSRLYQMVQLKTIQPPGAMANGMPHRPFPVSSVTLVLLPEGMECCGHPAGRLTNARYLASKAAGPDVRALQCMLHNMQYDDEMDWARYGDDGLFGPRTRAALQAFAQEVNFTEKGALAEPLPESGEFVTSAVAEQLKARCASAWKRPSYLELLDPRWDCSMEQVQTDERKKWRSLYHVRQLQADLKALGFDPVYIDGLLGPLTKSAIKRFQQAALKGMRLDSGSGRLVPVAVTFAGQATGALDVATKEEISRWLQYSPGAVLGQTPAAGIAGGQGLVPMDFASLKEGDLLSHPQGHAEVRIVRRGDDLQYFVPGEPAPRLVPRPFLPGTSPPEQKKIRTVQWGANDVYQTAFKVEFAPPSGAPPDPLGLSPKEYYLVNKFGMARQAPADVIALLFGAPPGLEVMPKGLEFERVRGMLLAARPSDKRFDGPVRYRLPGAEYSLYVFPSYSAEIVKDATGEVAARYESLVDLRVPHTGDGVSLTWSDPAGVVTVAFGLLDPVSSRRGLGALADDPGRAALLGEIRALGFRVDEKGSRFTLTELEAAKAILGKWKGRAGAAASIKSRTGADPRLVKDLLVSGGAYSTTTGRTFIPGYVELSEVEQKNVVIHELVHAFFHAAGLFVDLGKALPAGDASKKKDMDELIDDVWLGAETENATTFEDMKLEARLAARVKAVAAKLTIDAALLVRLMSRAGYLHLSSQDGHIKEGAIVEGRSYGRRKPHEWLNALCRDETLNEIWESLHDEFPSVPDLENSLDRRGLEIADESRYMGAASPRGDVVGHGFDNVSEFVSSFVASTLRYHAEMSAAVDGSGSQRLKSLYKELWDWVNANLVALGGSNPYG